MSAFSYQETLISIVADGTALTAAARASLTQNITGARITLAPNFFKVGSMLKVAAQGRISVASTPGTGRFDLAFNTTANCDSTAITFASAATTNAPWWLEILGTCRTIGSGTAATIFWFGTFTSLCVNGSSNNAATAIFTHGVAPNSGATAVGAGFDSTAAIPLDLYWTPSLATASITLQQYKVESLGPV